MKNRLMPIVLATLSVWLGGCAVYPEHDSYYAYEQPVTVAPPAPYYENPGYAPAVGFLWIDGYWNWSGVRYVWVPGRWEAPRPGYNWIPHRWEHAGDHWRHSGGTWERDTRQRVEPVHRMEPVPMRRVEPEVIHVPRAPTPVQVIAPQPDRVQRPEPVFVPRERDRREASDDGGRPRGEPVREHREIRAEPRKGDDRRAEPADKLRSDDRDDRHPRRGDKGDDR